MLRLFISMVGALAACQATNRTARAPEPTPDPAPIVFAGPIQPELPIEPVALDVAPEEPVDADLDEAVAFREGPAGHPDQAVYALRRGETLDHFARWSGVPVERLAEASDLALDELHAVGTEVLIEADDDLRATIDEARERHHHERAERYLAGRGGVVDQLTYIVRTGDTAWVVARRHGDLPVWILEGLNPLVDLGDLRPGQSLTLPVTADQRPEVDAVAEVAP